MMTAEASAAVEGAAAPVSVPPEAAREKLGNRAEEALGRLNDLNPHRLGTPYTLVVRLKGETTVHTGSHYPDAENIGDCGPPDTSDVFIEIMKTFSYVRR
ncbi:MAG: M55 family metallopeptidase [Acidobacteriota bacterium]